VYYCILSVAAGTCVTEPLPSNGHIGHNIVTYKQADTNNEGDDSCDKYELFILFVCGLFKDAETIYSVVDG
jgi:hypothetical protein